MTPTAPRALRNRTQSFRDPAAHVIVEGDRVLRYVNPDSVSEFRDFLTSELSAALVREGFLVKTTLADPAFTETRRDSKDDSDLTPVHPGLVLEHERVFFQSYPYEWPARMLIESGLLTIRLARRLLPYGFGLKDATPYNVLFEGPKPIFVDWGSFERRNPKDPTWLPYAQFVRTFIVPLLLESRTGLPLGDLLLNHRDGLDPEDAARRLTRLQLLSPGVLQYVTLPKVLSRFHQSDQRAIYQKRELHDPERAKFTLEFLFNRLERSLERLKSRQPHDSHWGAYMSTQAHYEQDQMRAKHDFVWDALTNCAPESVLDIGCNTGTFSLLAAKRDGTRVVAVDSDPVVVEALWQTASRDGLNILPLVVDFTRPTPATGWRNAECPSFLQRAAGSFDMVLMLAVLHHMLVTERIPLVEVLSLAASVTRRFAVIELVCPGDPMFDQITRGRDHLHQNLTPTEFENACRGHFKIMKRLQIGGMRRWIYLLSKVA